MILSFLVLPFPLLLPRLLPSSPFTVKAGDRIAQLILERILTPEVLEVEVSHSCSHCFHTTDLILAGTGSRCDSPRRRWIRINRRIHG